MEKYDLTYFEKELAGYGLVLTDVQKNRFIRYYELLTEWNRKINLTAITEFDDVIRKHFLDSLYYCRVPELPETGKMIDVGTGAGFPGIPLAIVFPDIQVTLLDSLQKRVSFLETCKTELELDNIVPIHARAEDAARDPSFREKFDCVVSRAVAAMPVLCEYCIPFVKTGGVFVSYKSLKGEQEAKEAEKAIHVLGGETEKICFMTLADTEEERSLIIIRKKDQTPGRYPRKSGTPAKKPIV